MKELDSSSISKFGVALWDAWGGAQKISKYCTSPEEDMFEDFLNDHYCSILEKVMKKGRKEKVICRSIPSLVIGFFNQRLPWRI